MKILQIDVNYGKSSTGKIVESIHKLNIEDGIESYVFYGRGKKRREKNIFKFGYDFETLLHALLTRLTGLTGFFSYFSTRRLIKAISRIKPNVIHIHELHAYFINIGTFMKFIKKNKFNTVWTFHCEFMYTGKCGHSLECNKWMSECGKCPLKKEYPKSLFFDFTKFMFNYKKKLFDDFDNLVIVSPSLWLQNRVRKSFLSNKNVVLINNGINLKDFGYKNPKELITKHKIENHNVVLAVAPNIMSKNKGGRFVLNLAKKMEAYPYKFIIIGNELSDEITASNVIMLGKIYNKETLSMYYSLANYFVIFSERENFPTTCIESLVCGTPIIGFRSGGTVEVATDEYGYFVDYGDLESIKSFLISNQLTPFKKRNEIIDYAIKRFSNEKMHLEYKKIYNSLR